VSPGAFELGVPATLACAALVLVAGGRIVASSAFLQRYSMPAAVVGGLAAALLLWVLYVAGTRVTFAEGLQPGLMLAFFATVGLGADLRTLAAGGSRLVRFALAVAAMLVLQNVIGVAGAKLFGLEPALGLLVGSITLAGGHGTGAAWGERLGDAFGIPGATGVALAAATFGLVAGGLVGGPVARRLVERLRAQGCPLGTAADAAFPQDDARAAGPLTPERLTVTILLVTTAMVAGSALARWADNPVLSLPSFVWTLIVGVVLRNLLAAARVHEVDDAALAFAGQVSLALFLATALMSLRLWEAVALAGPLLVILLAQVLAVAAMAGWLTYRLVGADYEAAVLAAGQCGFCLGVTPTAIANMQAVTERFGHAPQAFIVVPIMGAFVIDLINALVIAGFVAMLPMLR